VPIVSPITIAVADHRPRARIRSDRSRSFVRLGLVALTKVERAYYPGFRWSINFVVRLVRRMGIVFCGTKLRIRAIIEAEWPRKNPC